MNYSIFRITLDIHRHQSQVSIPVMYGDTAVRLLVTLSDGGTPYTIGKSCWAQFVAEKPGVDEPLTRACIIEGGTTICLDFDPGITNVAGLYNCEIRLYGAEGILTSPSFTMVVDPRVTNNNGVDDEEAVTLLDQIGLAVSKIKTAEGSRETAEQERATAEESRKTAEQERVSAERERKSAEAKRDERISKLEYKEILRSNESNIEGYIKITTPAFCYLDVETAVEVEGETKLHYFQLQCLAGTSEHKVIGIHNVTCAHMWSGPCTWYISVVSDLGVTVKVKDVFGENTNNITAELVSSIIPEAGETVEVLSDYYASRATVDRAIENLQKEIDNIDVNGGSTAYKEILRVNEGGKGYIAITTNTPSILEVAIIHSIYGEFEAAYLQLQCRGNSPSHSSLVSTEVSKVYTGHINGYEWQCVWYIPYSVSEYITVKVKDMLDDNVNEVTAEWLTSLPDEATEIQNYYASKTDLGNIDRALDNIIEIQNALIGGDA